MGPERCGAVGSDSSDHFDLVIVLTKTSIAQLINEYRFNFCSLNLSFCNLSEPC